MNLRLLLISSGTLALAGCSVGDRGIVTTKQPVVAGRIATVPGCPDWSDAGWNAGEGMAANYGCGVNGTLAAMIADPADLLHGKSGTPDAEIAVRALKAWRETQPTGKQGVEKVGSKGN